MMIRKKEDFNVILVGTGGQGIITLQKVITQAALLSGFDVKSSELHGLSQRGGSVESHVRFGKKIFSPLVRQGGADLILGLEPQEALRACYYASKEAKSTFLVNTSFIPIPFEKQTSSKEIEKTLKKFSQSTTFINATEIVLKENGVPVTAGIFMLGYAAFNGLLALKEKFLLQAMKNVIKPKYFEMNERVFNLTN